VTDAERHAEMDRIAPRWRGVYQQAYGALPMSLNVKSCPTCGAVIRAIEVSPNGAEVWTCSRGHEVVVSPPKPAPQADGHP